MSYMERREYAQVHLANRFYKQPYSCTISPMLSISFSSEVT
jgi:hypothetical protein